MPVTLTLATTDGQPTQQLTLPTSWAEVSLSQYLAAHAAGSAHAPALRLSGLADAVLDGLPVEQAADLAHHLSFATDEAALEALLPTPGLFEIGLTAYGLCERAAKYLGALPPDAHPLTFGAYLHALYTGRVGSKVEAGQLAAAHAAVLARPLPEVYADCQYYLLSWGRIGQRDAYTGAEQPGLLRIVPVPPPAVGLWARLTQWLRRVGAPGRPPRAGIIR